MSQLVVFTNPKTAATYTWEVNPAADSEQPLTKQRQIERTSKTGNVGAVKQQGDDGPLIFDWQINVPTRTMETTLFQWYQLCATQTIYITDWDGDEYEGQIITLTRTRKVAAVPYAVYQIQFEVWRVISGLLATAGISA